MSLAREELYRLIDALPESEIAVAKRFLQFIVYDSEGLRLEPFDEAEVKLDFLKSIQESEEEIQKRKGIPWEEAKKGLGL